MRSLKCLLLCGVAASTLAVYGGARTLQVPARFNAGDATPFESVFAGDFTGDGKSDVLIADRMESTIVELRVTPGQGNGAFGPEIVTTVTGLVPQGLAHFNGDNRPDLYLWSHDGAIAVMLSAANGTFSAPVELPSSVTATEVIAGDFTGDGLTDLAIVSEVYDQIVVFAGNGSGGFPTLTSTALPLYHDGDLAAGDFDDDGHLDIASGSYIAWNSGTSFTIERLNDSGATYAVAAGDVNGDGISDLITSWNFLLIYFGKTTRGLTPTALPDVGGDDQNTVTVAAMDGDGRADVIVGVRGGGGVTVVSHDGTAFRTPRSFGLGESTHGLAAADFDGDCKTDVAGITFNTGGYFWTVRGKGDRTLHADIAFDLYAHIGMGGWGTFISDVNGDSKMDIIATTYNEHELAVLFGAGEGTFSAPVLTDLPNSSYGSMHDAGDLNGDGRIDVVLWEPAGEEAKLSVFFSQTNGTFIAGPVQLTDKIIGNHIRLLPIVDYTGDGKNDIFDESGLLLPGLGNGAFGAPIATGIDTWPATTRVAEVNDDGKPDLIVLLGNDLFTYINTGGGTFAAPTLRQWYHSLAVADLNGDGFADLAGYGIALGAGNGTYADAPFGIDAGVTDGADFDGDGRMDLASSHGILFGTGTGAFDGGAEKTAMGSIISVADFDGNGAADVWTLGRWVTIARAGVAPEPALASQLELTTPLNPRPFGSYGQLIARPVPSSTIARARGVVFFSKPQEAPFALSFLGSDGTAKWWIPAPPVDGSTTYGSSFSGDTFLLPSSSSSLTITGTRGTSATTITTSKSAYDAGQSVIISAFARGGATAPTGTVVVKKGETVLKTLTNGGGTFAINDAAIFPLGTHTLTAHYEGDGNYLPSVSSPRTITIKKPTPVMTLSLSGLSPYTYNQQVTMTAAFPNHSDVTGSVTFLCFGQTLGSATISNAQAVLSAPMPWGDGTCMATYAGDAKYGASSGFSYATSHYAKMATPPIVVATAISPYEVVVSISPIAGATHYDIYRSIDGSPLVHINSTHTTINHHPPSGTKVVVFAAAAKNTTTGAITAAGPRDFASMVQFSSSAAASTLIKATDVSELQSAVNALRVATGLAATTFSPPAGLISAAHLNSLRTAITQARSAFGMATSFSDPTITPGTTKVRAVHWQQLREGLK